MTKKPSLQLDQKIKSFFVLYFAKTNVHSLLTKLCCQTTTSRRAGFGEGLSFSEEAGLRAGHRQQGRDVCVYDRVSQGLTNGLYHELSRQLRDLILKFITP